MAREYPPRMWHPASNATTGTMPFFSRIAFLMSALPAHRLSSVPMAIFAVCTFVGLTAFSRPSILHRRCGECIRISKGVRRTGGAWGRGT
eukprot:4757883-Pyramimonas_sp.AAC.1